MPREEALPPEPKPKMPARKAVFAILLAVLFDALKFVCNFLIFFAPLIAGFLAGVYASSSGLPSWASGAIGVIAGGSTAVLEAAGGAAVVGVVGAIMSVIIGFMGWLFFIVWFLITNVPMLTSPRRFLKIVWGFVTSSVPILNALPSFTIFIGRIILDVRKEDRAARKTWDEELQEAHVRLQQAQLTRLARARLMQEQMLAREIGEEEIAVEAEEAGEEREAIEAVGMARRRQGARSYEGEGGKQRAANDELYAPYEEARTPEPGPAFEPRKLGPAANDPQYGGIHREAA